MTFEALLGVGLGIVSTIVGLVWRFLAAKFRENREAAKAAHDAALKALEDLASFRTQVALEYYRKAELNALLDTKLDPIREKVDFVIEIMLERKKPA